MRLAVLVMAAGVASAGAGQRNAIDVKLSTDNGATWSDQIINNLWLGDPVHITVGVFYDRVSGHGFGGSIHSVVVDGWRTGRDAVTLLDRLDSAMHPDGRQGRFNFGAQRQAAYTAGADLGTLRIAADNNTQNDISRGISVRQRTPPASGSLFDTNNPAYGYRFEITIAAWEPTDPLLNRWNFLTPRDRLASFAIYEAASSQSLSNLDLSSVMLDGAYVQLYRIPAPFTMGVIAAGMTSVLSRRRED